MDGFPGLLVVPLIGAAVVVLVGVGIYRFANRRTTGSVIKVVGVGSGGANAVEAMMRGRIRGVDFVVVNSDVRALRHSSARTSIQIGKEQTNGLGTGGDASVGEQAARDSAEAIGRALRGADLVVITAGLGGGTGTGAAPVVADIAHQQGALTMAVVTKPFAFEGGRRRRIAEQGAATLAGKVDAVATVANDRVRSVISAEATVDEAFAAIDDVVSRSIGQIVNIIAMPGPINLDFSDIRSVLQDGGVAALGVGRASGEDRAANAAKAAMATTLLERGMEGASSILLSVAGYGRVKLAELDTVVEVVLAKAGPDASLVFGMGTDRDLKDEIQVTLIATGLESGPVSGAAAQAVAEEWRPVWLRRGVPVEAPAPTSSPEKSRRHRRRPVEPPRPAAEGPDLGSSD